MAVNNCRCPVGMENQCTSGATVQHDQANCGPVVTADTEGYLTSPGWPNQYPNNVDCTWDIKADENMVRLLYALIRVRYPIAFQQFLPEASMAIGYFRCLRLSVCPCVNHLLVRAITRDPFKLGSPNLNHRCKRPWLRSLLFWGWLTFTFKAKLTFEVIIYSDFELVPAITHHPFKLGPPNLDQMCKIPWLRPLLFIIIGGWLSLTCQI